jgi:2-keto-3-deoxy-L-arabinonate dehydratase
VTRYAGVFPVLYAFFGRDGRLDAGAMRAQVEHCLACGAAGITVLGLVTEVHKLDVNERLELVRVVGGAIDGRVPCLVTVAEPSVGGQVAFARAAADLGASAVILQPPPVRGASEAEVVRFLAEVAQASPVDVGVQNNPVNLDVSLSTRSLEALLQAASVAILKAEGAGWDIAEQIRTAAGGVAVLGGHGGIEFMSLLRAGGHGLIPAPDFLRPQVRLLALWARGTPEAREEAEAIHRAILPAIVFMSRSVPGMLCYGKRLVARQIGLAEPGDRPPAQAPTAFGLSELDRIERQLANAALPDPPRAGRAAAG